MTINAGTIDRVVRAIPGVALLSLAFAGGALDGSVWQWIAASAGGVMLTVAALRFCPAHTLIGLKTCAAV